MAVGLLGRKVGMTQIFDLTGQAIPVTVIEAGPCHVLQLRTEARDGYEAVQLGYLDKPRRLASRSVRGHVAPLESKRHKQLSTAGVQILAKANCEPKRFVREFRGAAEGYEVGQVITAGFFAPKLADLRKAKLEAAAKELEIGTEEEGWEEKVREKSAEAYDKALAEAMAEAVKGVALDVTGTSKGRGTAGVMKRHNFHGQRASHGVKKVHRRTGSIGMNTSPHHVFKGHPMAGRMGAERCTVRNLQLVSVDPENNLLVICGAIPGAIGSYVMVRASNKLGPGSRK